MTCTDIEKIEFLNFKNQVIIYTVENLLSEDDNFITFLDKFGAKQTLNKKNISRRWTVRGGW